MHEEACAYIRHAKLAISYATYNRICISICPRSVGSLMYASHLLPSLDRCPAPDRSIHEQILHSILLGSNQQPTGLTATNAHADRRRYRTDRCGIIPRTPQRDTNYQPPPIIISVVSATPGRRRQLLRPPHTPELTRALRPRRIRNFTS